MKTTSPAKAKVEMRLTAKQIAKAERLRQVMLDAVDEYEHKQKVVAVWLIVEDVQALIALVDADEPRIIAGDTPSLGEQLRKSINRRIRVALTLAIKSASRRAKQ